ncbi:hypothetical protein HK405_013830 [Cladochytrium tenue]|nr:hypothetical protein HK405_013830 [Cladochytrium tenue]
MRGPAAAPGVDEGEGHAGPAPGVAREGIWTSREGEAAAAVAVIELEATVAAAAAADAAAAVTGDQCGSAAADLEGIREDGSYSST